MRWTPIPALCGRSERPRRSFRSLLRYPRWRTMALTALLFTLSTFLAHWEFTRDNIGWLFGWPLRLAAKIFGEGRDLGNPIGALVHTASNLVNLLFLFVASALILREGKKTEEGDGSSNPVKSVFAEHTGRVSEKIVAVQQVTLPPCCFCSVLWFRIIVISLKMLLCTRPHTIAVYT